MGPAEPPVASLTVEPATLTLELGFTQRLTAVPRDAAGAALPSAGVVWESSDTTVVAVSADSGLATARAPGTARVRATIQGLSATAEIRVPHLTFTTISVGNAQICGVTTAAVAYCWGRNNAAQLGNGDTTGELRLVPEPVAGAQHFQSVSTAGYHSCGVTETGAAYCWGLNVAGELGDGIDTLEMRAEPVAVVGNLAFASVHVGGPTCGLTVGGLGYCWGGNIWGSVGDGTTSDRYEPVAVSGNHTFTSLSVNSHVCGLLPDSTAYCWGDNRSGQLGDGTTTGRFIPTAVAGNLTFKSITAGQAHTCGVTPSDEAYCWGSNYQGVLGDGTSVERATPGPVAGGLRFQFVGAGGLHTCGLTTDGAAYCWGYNLTGTLGQPPGQVHDSPVPVPVTGGLTFLWLEVGGNDACGKATDGLVYCWGANPFGQLGIGVYSTGSYQPVPIFGQQ